jgi:phage FluMu protein Com
MARIKRKPEVRGGLYRCAHCLKLFRRESTKAWIVSFCESTSKKVRLQRFKARHPLP